MATVYRITGSEDTYPTEDDARAAMRAPFLGRNGSWAEERDSKGHLKVTYSEMTKAGKPSAKGDQKWTISREEQSDQ